MKMYESFKVSISPLGLTFLATAYGDGLVA